jgi:hypothetical protein
MENQCCICNQRIESQGCGSIVWVGETDLAHPECFADLWNQIASPETDADYEVDKLVFQLLCDGTPAVDVAHALQRHVGLTIRFYEALRRYMPASEIPPELLAALKSGIAKMRAEPSP